MNDQKIFAFTFFSFGKKINEPFYLEMSFYMTILIRKYYSKTFCVKLIHFQETKVYLFSSKRGHPEMKVLNLEIIQLTFLNIH